MDWTAIVLSVRLAAVVCGILLVLGLPIAFSLFHYTNMEDASFMLISGMAPILISAPLYFSGKTSFGAETRYNFVRDHGVGYRPRPNISGNWQSITDTISPAWVGQYGTRRAAM